LRPEQKILSAYAQDIYLLNVINIIVQLYHIYRRFSIFPVNSDDKNTAERFEEPISKRSAFFRQRHSFPAPALYLISEKLPLARAFHVKSEPAEILLPFVSAPDHLKPDA